VVPKLSAAIEKAGQKYSEDALAARVCLAEISWLRDEKSTVLEALSEDVRSGGNHAPTLGWLEVCEAKAAFLYASTLESIGKEEEARKSYLRAVTKVPGSRSSELRRWTERLLARACMFMKRRTTEPSISTLGDALRCFNAWSDFWQRSPPPISNGSSSTSHLDIPRRQVWRANYDLLSTILSHGLMYSPSSSRALLFPSDDIPDDQYAAEKLKQRVAMKRVESTYESLLLNETQFPKAGHTNTEVEEWAEQVVSNWQIFSGPEWTDAELGEGGKEQLGRGVLDILYRAATKTFHSTAILRHLFTVHAALGEFELAIHAFNSYVEIVDKSKARADKSGHHDPGLDDDETTMLTAADAVQILCRYGDREQAEKALEMAKTITRWLRIDEKKPEAILPLQPRTTAAAYRALGVSRGHWARLTYENELRSSLRAEAVQHLREAQKHDPNSLESSYALALVLADSRDVTAAMWVLRQAFATPQVEKVDGEDDNDDEEDESTEFRRARDLVPLWHLMALCLTAKDDHEQGAKMCEAAFEQFGDAATLFGEENHRSSVDTRRTMPRSSRGVIDSMEGFEKAELLRVKMSQLTLLELMEGAEVAVDVSHELLALYARLFGSPDDLKPPARPPQTASTVTPSKGGGTLRSLAGSIRPKSMRSSLEKPGYKNGSMATLPEDQPSTRFERRNEANGSANGVPISITVTNEDGEKAHHHHTPFKLRGHHGDWREHGNLKSSPSASSLRQQAATTDEEPPTLPAINTEKIDHAPVQPAVAQSTDKSGQLLTDIQHNAPHDAWPPPAGHDDQPPQQDVRLPVPHPVVAGSPEIRLSSAQERRHKISLLVELWLFIAGLYLRADLYDDASGAIMEAHKLVDLAEADAATQQLNARGLYEKRWGGGKSVDMLWACVWTAVSLPTVKIIAFGILTQSTERTTRISSLSALPCAGGLRAIPGLLPGPP
jgi:cargo-transport protein YPP1